MIKREVCVNRPTGVCSKCKEILNLDELHQLPEVETYARNMALFMLHKGKKPALYSEEALESRYGYGFKDLFCSSCYNGVIGIPVSSHPT